MATVLFLVAVGVLAVACVVGQIREWLAARSAARTASGRLLGDLLHLARRVSDGASDGELSYLAAVYGARMGLRARGRHGGSTRRATLGEGCEGGTHGHHRRF